MADIILAECGTNGWLVCGEQYIDDLLANTLPAHVSIEVVTCESKSAVIELWTEYEGGDDPAMMWLIHPNIIRRARGQAGQLSVEFTAWSAAMDDRAESAMQTAADQMLHVETRRLSVVRYVDAAGLAAAGDMANLRASLIEARLAALGVAPSRIIRETQPPEQPGQMERIDLVIRDA